MGPFTVELYEKHAPRTCRNFIELSRRGYYDNVKFHRIIKDFIVQGGDPTGTGRGGESIYGSRFQDEITSELKHTGAGILSMANAGPNTNGSQFCITLAVTQSLDGNIQFLGGFEWYTKVDTQWYFSIDGRIQDVSDERILGLGRRVLMLFYQKDEKTEHEVRPQSDFPAGEQQNANPSNKAAEKHKDDSVAPVVPSPPDVNNLQLHLVIEERRDLPPWFIPPDIEAYRFNEAPESFNRRMPGVDSEGHQRNQVTETHEGVEEEEVENDAKRQGNNQQPPVGHLMGFYSF